MINVQLDKVLEALADFAANRWPFPVTTRLYNQRTAAFGALRRRQELLKVTLVPYLPPDVAFEDVGDEADWKRALGDSYAEALGKLKELDNAEVEAEFGPPLQLENLERFAGAQEAAGLPVPVFREESQRVLMDVGLLVGGAPAAGPAKESTE